MKKTILKLFLGALIGAVVLIGGGIAYGIQKSKSTPLIPSSPQMSLDDLNAFLEQKTYEIGFYAKNLSTGEIITRNSNRSVCLASIVKIFALTELYRQKHEQGLDLDQKIDVPKHGSISIKQTADLMIGKSDNDATQALAEFLGREQVNKIPSLLRIDSLNENILPSLDILRETLDQRIHAERIADSGLPQHGSAEGIAKYFELLLEKKVISEPISADLLTFFSEHPKPFSNHYARQYKFAGKGGNIQWTRPPKHYSMMGWGLFIMKPSGEYITLCVWGEWFPESIKYNQQLEILKYITDCILSLEES